MAWVRLGDASAMHPTLLNVLEHPDLDDRLLNETAGFVWRCACQAGAHLTDYVVSMGTAIQVAGASRVTTLLDVATRTGLMTQLVEDDGRTVAYKLVDDDPEFIHLRLKREIEWEQQRKTDSARPSLIVPVRLRDGDGCRWCGCIVDWHDRKSGRAGTYDHLNPGEPATIDTYVVCCKSCNSSRRDGAAPQGRTEPLPAPTPSGVYFSQKTVDWLTDNEWRRSQGIAIPTAAARFIRPGDPADGSQPPAPPTRSDRKTGSRTRVAISTAPSDDLSSADPDPTSTRVAISTAPSTPTRVAISTAPSVPVGPDHGQTRVAISTAPSDPAGDEPPGETGETGSADICRYQPDSVDRHGTGSIPSGRVGSGRVGSPDPPTSRDSSSRPRAGRRRRRTPHER